MVARYHLGEDRAAGALGLVAKRRARLPSRGEAGLMSAVWLY